MLVGIRQQDMKKIVLLFLCIIILSACAKSEISKVCTDEICFDVEIADSLSERKQGLMYREHLEENKGMLFIFDEQKIHPFWMKNTLIPLDIIWIDEQMEIVSIFPNAQPCKTEQCDSIRPLKKAKYVLEINGGMAAEKGIDVHDFIEFK